MTKFQPVENLPHQTCHSHNSTSLTTLRSANGSIRLVYWKWPLYASCIPGKGGCMTKTLYMTGKYYPYTRYIPDSAFLKVSKSKMWHLMAILCPERTLDAVRSFVWIYIGSRIPKIMPSTTSRHHLLLQNHHILCNPGILISHFLFNWFYGSANENRRVYPNCCQNIQGWHNAIPRTQGLVWGMQKKQNSMHNWGYWLHRGN